MKGLRKLAFVCSACFAFTGTAALLPVTAPLTVSAEEEWFYDEAKLVRYGISGEEAYAAGIENPEYDGTVHILPEINGVPVTRIAPEAFRDTPVTAVTVPGSVTEIGYSAFAGTALTEASLPDSVRCIESNAFSFCPQLTAVTLPAGLESAESAFSDCPELTDVTIPDSALNAIDATTFAYTKWLQDRQDENPLVIIRNKVLDGTQTTGDIVIPDGVTSIGNSAFYRNNKITSVRMPDSVTAIGSNAFYGCYRIEDLFLPAHLTEIGERAFEECQRIMEVRIPGSVQKIGDYAFLACIKLESAEIEEGVTEIGVCAFASCTKLSDIRVPHSITRIGNDAFRETPWLEARQENTLACVNSFLFDGQKAIGSVTVPAGVTCISDGAFEYNEQLTDIILPETLTRIERNAFCECSCLHEITIPAGVESIGEFAFYASNLQHITILNPACEIDRTYGGQAICSRAEQPHRPDSRCVFYGVIHGYDNSTAEAFAKDNNYKFVSLGEAPAFPGDLTGDYTVGIEDAQLALKAYTETVSGKSSGLTAKQCKAADVNGSGDLTVEDAQLILIYYTEKEVAGKIIIWEQLVK